MKKRVVTLLTIAALTVALAACGNRENIPKTMDDSKAASSETKEQSRTEEFSGKETKDDSTGEVLGGWVLNDDNTMADLPAEARKVFDQVMEDYTGMALTPVAYLGSQVVSGVNHMLLCKGAAVTAEPVTALKVVVIYEPISGDPEILKITDFDLSALADENADMAAGEIEGGWNVYEEQDTVNLPVEAQKAFDQAFDGLTGASYEPLSLLGMQVVSGMNYAYLVKQTLITNESVVNLAVAYVYAPLEGNAEVMNIVPIILDNYS